MKKVLATLLWLGVALVGAWAYATLAMRRTRQEARLRGWLEVLPEYVVHDYAVEERFADVAAGRMPGA